MILATIVSIKDRFPVWCRSVKWTKREAGSLPPSRSRRIRIEQGLITAASAGFRIAALAQHNQNDATLC